MSVTNAAYLDPAHTRIRAEFDGVEFVLMADPANAHYARLLNEDVAIAPFVPEPSAIKAEAGRRILDVVPMWKQANLTARAVQLVDKVANGEALTEDQSQEHAAIAAVWSWVAAMRTTSGVLEASLPADYADDSHWPEPPVIPS